MLLASLMKQRSIGLKDKDACVLGPIIDVLAHALNVISGFVLLMEAVVDQPLLHDLSVPNQLNGAPKAGVIK